MISVHAPAKLNLDLRVVGRQPDGYHELRTIFQSISLSDTLTLRSRPGPLTVRCRNRSVPPDEANVVWTAATLLWRDSGHDGAPHGATVSITKRIPVSGGLGGGSSNAAAALRALATLWGVTLAPSRLVALASRVGADVPYFLKGGVVLGTGRGDHLRCLADLKTLWVVLAFPVFGVSTPIAYQWFDRMRQPVTPPLRSDWRGHLDTLHNDLEPPVVERHPAVGRMVDRLRATGAIHAAMTGSGSTVFGLYSRRTDAITARGRARLPGWKTLICETLGREQYGRVTTLARGG